jgi:transcription elongation factor Elf1
MCPKCKKDKPLTRHHIKPIRHFGKKHNNDTVLICRDCHDELEQIIPFQLMPVMEYFKIVDLFLEESIG